MLSRANFKSHPIHPILVAFPIGLWTTSLIFDLLGIWLHRPSLWAAGFYAIIAGAAGAFLAAIPGAIDWWTVVPPQSSAKNRGLVHGSLNIIILALFITVAAIRGGPAAQPTNPAILLSAIGVGMLRDR